MVPNQTLIERFRAEVFEKDELEYHNFYHMKAVLPLLADQDFNFLVKSNYHDNDKGKVCLDFKVIIWHFHGKTKKDELKKFKFE